MFRKRLAITGIGVVSPAALGIEAFWQAILTGRSFLGPIESFDASSFPTAMAGELKDFSARSFVPKSYRKAVKVMARDIEIAVAAADLAFKDAKLVTAAAEDAAEPTYPLDRVGCSIGAGLICSDLGELGIAVTSSTVDGKFDMKRWGSAGMNNLTPLWLLKYLPNMLSCHVTIIHGATGPSNTLTCGSASSLMAIAEAGYGIAEGRADAAIAGGAESKANPMGLLRQDLLGRLCRGRQTPRPFDEHHSGTVIAEAGGLVVLEDFAAAQRRGARIYAELIGFGAAADPTSVDLERRTVGRLDLAVAHALREAELAPEQVDLIVVQGTGVPAEDLAEVAAWRAALGERAASVPAAAALTGAIGSGFAGDRGIAMGTAAMALATQTVPPTAGYAKPAPGCELNLSSQPRSATIRHAVVAGFAFAGQSAACVLRRAQP